MLCIVLPIVLSLRSPVWSPLCSPHCLCGEQRGSWALFSIVLCAPLYWLCREQRSGREARELSLPVALLSGRPVPPVPKSRGAPANFLCQLPSAPWAVCAARSENSGAPADFLYCQLSFPPERPLPKSSEAVANCLCRLSCVPCTALLALQTLEATALEAVSSHALCALFVALKCLKPALSRAISCSLRLKARGPSTTTIAFAAHRAIAFSGQPIPPRLPSKSGTCCLPGLTVHQAASTRASRSCRRFRCRACSA